LGEQAETDKAVIGCLVDALRDENSMVRAAAAAALGRIGDRDAVAPLIALLRNTREDRDVRSRAAESLGQLQAAEAVPDLIAALNDTVWHVRLHSVNALGRIEDPEAAESLKNTARYDPDFGVRNAAREVLDQMGISVDEDDGVDSNE
jgi:HEAT repeat protein